MNTKNKLNNFLEEITNGNDSYIEKLKLEYEKFVSENYAEFYMSSILDEITSKISNPVWIPLDIEQNFESKLSEYSNSFPKKKYIEFIKVTETGHIKEKDFIDAA